MEHDRSAPWTPLVVGALLRVIAAWGYGIFASDDYLYVLAPAYEWLSQPDVPYPSEIRSPLLAHVAFVVMRAASWLGVSEPVQLVRAVYFALGAWSLVAIAPAYDLARNAYGERAGHIAAWLMAAQALLPRLSTRALIEVVCIPPLLLGLALVDRAMREPRHASTRMFIAGLCLGLAAMLRFQTALVGLVVVVWCIANHKALGRALWALAAALALVLVAEVLWSLARHGSLHPTAWRYVAWNLRYSDKFGTSAWHTYIVFFILLTLPPLTFGLARPLWRSLTRAPLVSVSLLVFVVVHSMVGHKEERFMFPGLALFMVPLAGALAELFVRQDWLALTTRRAFVALNLVGLVLVTLSDGQRSLITPLVEASRDSAIQRIVYVRRKGPRAPTLYLGRNVELIETRDEARAIELAREAHRPTRFLFTRAPEVDVAAQLVEHGYQCAAPRSYAGDLIDQLLVWVRPKQNARRAPLLGIDCS